MRLSRAVWALGLSLLAGCAVIKPKHDDGAGTGRPPHGQVEEQRPATEADLVRYLNKEAKGLQSLDVSELFIDAAAQGRKAPGVRGWMVCDKPRNFRLQGKVVATEQIDLGSNNERFWFWLRESPDQALVHCSYTDFEKGVQLPFPFNPDWVIQALGMAEYGADDTDLKRFRLEPVGKTDKSMKLVESTTLQGKPVQKETVFNRWNVTAPTPQVIAHVLRDEKGKVICSATIKEVRESKVMNPETRRPISYPRKIVLEWPVEQLTMTLTLDKVEVNKPIPPQEAAKLFSLPSYFSKTVDLAQQFRVSPSSRVQQAGGYYYH
jgi:hypothetical protein